MDEEQQPKKKIDIDSFFNRVDAVEGLASSALKQSSINANTIKANQTLINSISVSIEAMKTEIRDIANYIVIENKLEKDKKEDEKFEAEDKEQKSKFEEGLKVAAQGTPTAKNLKDTGGESGKKTGGGFLGGLFKLIGGAGLLAGLVILSPLIAKALVIAGIAGIGVLTAVVLKKIAGPVMKWITNFGKKIKNFLDKVFKPIEKIPIVGKVLSGALKGGLIGGLPGLFIGASKGLYDTLTGGKGEISGGETGGGETGGGEEIKSADDSNVKLDNKDVEESSKKILDAVDDNKEMKVTRKTRNMTSEDIKTRIEDTKAEIKEMEESGANERKIAFRKKELGILEDTLKMMRISSGNLTETEKILRDSGQFEGESKFSATETIIQAETGDSFSNRLDLNEGVQTTETPNVTGVDFENTATTVISTDFNKNTNLGNIDPKLKKILLKAIQ